jgi:hypothetical protein
MFAHDLEFQRRRILKLTILQYAFSRDFRKKGMIALNTYLRQYR